MTTLKIATTNDLPLIYQLAKEIWQNHYLAMISQEQIDYMLHKFYSDEALRISMGEGQIFYLINNEKNQAIGYLAVTEKQAGSWFMNKFYIATHTQRKGIGSEILNQWEIISQPQELCLQVNRKNFKSINFYFKSGFTIREVADFDIGHGYSMDDFIMAKRY